MERTEDIVEKLYKTFDKLDVNVKCDKLNF